MEFVSNNIVKAMDLYIFKNNVKIDPGILRDVPRYKVFLRENIHNEEEFHGYINKINTEWATFLSDSFKRLIAYYNAMYERYYNMKLQRQREIIEFANDYMADKLHSDIEEMSLSGNISSLTNSMRRSGITKKRPSKRRN